MRFSCVLKGLTALLLGLVLASSVFAQSETTNVPTLDGSLTEAEFEAMLGRLSDEQVRDILIQEFATRRSETPEASSGILENAQQIGEQMSANVRLLLGAWPNVGQAFQPMLSRLSEAGGIGLALFALVLSFAAGITVRFFWRRKATLRQLELAERNLEVGAYGSLSTIGDACLFILIELSSVVAFAIAAMATLYACFHHPDIRDFVSAFIAMATITLLVYSFVTFFFPRDWAPYRLVAISDEATRVLHYSVIGLAALWVLESIGTELITHFGTSEATGGLISLAASLLWIVGALTAIYMLHRATTELLPSPEDTGFSNALVRNWAMLMAIGSIVTWLIFALGGLASGDVDAIAPLILATQLVLMGIWVLFRILVFYLDAQNLDDSIRLAIRRTASTVAFAAALILVLGIWGLEGPELAAGGPAERWFQAIVSVGLTALIGWAAWDFIRTLIDIRIAAEEPEADNEDASEGEGGLGASRTATLLPLLRSFAMAAIGLTCLFTALSSLGVNVAPLVAGAGVIGLAIGFGAQTLVKDVVSGVFFLIDDAFRRGEYIDLGSVKGTVERISVRSLQLRHHLGAVHTIPFGDIAALTNYSRDWVIMKLPLRLTFDTDPQQVKKIVKRIGAELMEDELVGGGLLEPPKSQGVIQMEDSAMILRVKFMAIPGKQFTIRRELLHRIRAEFETAGIRFANREVTVRVNEDATPEERKEAINAAASRATEPEPNPT